MHITPSAPYQAFRSADGWFTLGAPNTRAWQSLCRVLRRDDLLHDSRFVDENARFANRSALAREMKSTTKGRATAEIDSTASSRRGLLAHS